LQILLEILGLHFGPKGPPQALEKNAYFPQVLDVGLPGGGGQFLTLKVLKELLNFRKHRLELCSILVNYTRKRGKVTAGRGHIMCRFPE
jgi:hypothetical protein